MSYESEMSELAQIEFDRCGEDDDILACRAPAVNCWRRAVADGDYLGSLNDWEKLPLRVRMDILRFGGI